MAGKNLRKFSSLETGFLRQCSGAGYKQPDSGAKGVISQKKIVNHRLLQIKLFKHSRIFLWAKSNFDEGQRCWLSSSSLPPLSLTGLIRMNGNWRLRVSNQHSESSLIVVLLICIWMHCRFNFELVQTFNLIGSVVSLYLSVQEKKFLMIPHQPWEANSNFLPSLSFSAFLPKLSTFITGSNLATISFALALSLIEEDEGRFHQVREIKTPSGSSQSLLLCLGRAFSL